MPSLLGLDGRLATGYGAKDESLRWASSGGAWTRGLLCEDCVIGGTGGLCGSRPSPLEVSFPLYLPPSAIMVVEADDEDVEDSRTVERV